MKGDECDGNASMNDEKSSESRLSPDWNNGVYHAVKNLILNFLNPK